MTNTTNKSFILHKDSLCILNQLSDEQAGMLFKAIYKYQNDGEIDGFDQLIKIAIIPFINQFERDNQKYKAIVDRNKQNIAKRWYTKNTTGKSGIPNDTKNTDNDSDSDSDSDNKKEKEKDKKEKEILIPDFIDIDNWNNFLLMRKKAKAFPTEKAITLLIKDLTKFENNNTGNANKALEESIKNNWKGVFEPKNNNLNKKYGCDF